MRIFHWFRGSLPARAGVAVLLIGTLALGSAVSAGLIAWLSEDDAAAINTAGSLRMSVYKLSWRLQAGTDNAEIQRQGDNFRHRLESINLTRILRSDPQSPLAQAYAGLRERWHSQLAPALERGDVAVFHANADDFVEQLNQFVLLLQRKSERKQSWQLAIQGTALFVTVMVLMVGMYSLQSSVLSPLQELVRATERFRAGDLSARVQYRSEDELGHMANSFNAMAEALEQSHHTLESRVTQKTAHLAQANAALQLLYQGSRSLASGPASAESLDKLIDSFQNRLPGLRLTLCLHGDPREPAEQLIALHGSELREICSPGDCATCTLHQRRNIVASPVVNQGSELGELRAAFADGRPPQQWELELIEALANLIGTALSLERRREQDHRLLLFEERAIIARELHDSLAQALSYMKLQVSRLQTLMHRGEPPEKLEKVTEEIRDGLNNAYRQLRELLTTFRLKIQEGGLRKALDDTAREFSERGQFPVQLNVKTLPFGLSASEQIHLLQIAREALSNCARHSGASHVWLTVQQVGSEVEMLIEDDGCGVSLDFDPRLHHGLTIMLERSRNLHGRLRIEQREPNGTRVQLNFAPQFLGRDLERDTA
ncbi:protein NarX [Stutzerimonas degradans]|nr:protein NarX [Stutzerimonas degradans]